MKYIFFILLLLFITGCATSATVEKPTSVIEEPDGKLTCPRGITDDAYPGICGQYVDNNKDGFCDHGQ